MTSYPLIKRPFGDVVRSLPDLDPDLMICAPRLRPLLPETEVALIREEAGDLIPANLCYLLAVFWHQRFSTYGPTGGEVGTRRSLKRSPPSWLRRP